MNLSGKRIGMVLSGGGAKGAYHVGMFRALEELQIHQSIQVISGCSIGAYNALCYEVGGTDLMREFIWNFDKYYKAGIETPEEVLAEAKTDVLSGKIDLPTFCHEPRFRRCSAEPMREYLEKILPDERLKGYQRKLWSCAYSLEEECPQYFVLNELDGRSQREMVLASASLSFIFPPVAYQGQHYLDGGEIPEICTNGKPEDRIPLTPMAKEDLDVVMVGYLIPSDVVDQTMLKSGTRCIELRPSRFLEAYPGEGTLDFSLERLRSHEELGYRDTLDYLSKLEDI